MRLRALILIGGMLGLLAGLTAGLVRLGWLSGAPADLAALHGPLMVMVFLGTVIPLERAVALARPVALLAPALSAAGGIALLVGLSRLVGGTALCLGAVGLVVILAVLTRREPVAHMVLLLLASVVIAAADLAWLVGAPVFQVAWAWASGLVLTIAAERLELARLSRPPAWARSILLVLGVALASAAAVQAMAPAAGAVLLGLVLVALTAWLLRFDLALRTMRTPGLPRFIATCLVAGYAWLGVAGLLLLVAGPQVAGPVYDAQLHAVFVGFVFSMIMGHAPVILPAVLRVVVPLRRILLAARRLAAWLAGAARGGRFAPQRRRPGLRGPAQRQRHRPVPGHHRGLGPGGSRQRAVPNGTGVSSGVRLVHLGLSGVGLSVGSARLAIDPPDPVFDPVLLTWSEAERVAGVRNRTPVAALPEILSWRGIEGTALTLDGWTDLGLWRIRTLAYTPIPYATPREFLRKTRSAMLAPGLALSRLQQALARPKAPPIAALLCFGEVRIAWLGQALHRFQTEAELDRLGDHLAGADLAVAGIDFDDEEAAGRLLGRLHPRVAVLADLVGPVRRRLGLPTRPLQAAVAVAPPGTRMLEEGGLVEVALPN